MRYLPLTVKIFDLALFKYSAIAGFWGMHVPIAGVSDKLGDED
jgi:hypothetical protein